MAQDLAQKKIGIPELNIKYPDLVPEAGVEPACPCEHWCLRPARLPIPPSGHFTYNQNSFFENLITVFKRGLRKYLIVLYTQKIGAVLN